MIAQPQPAIHTDLPHPRPTQVEKGVEPLSTPLLEAERVSFWVGDRQLLRDVSLALCPGEVAGLIGPNGAGKSTLLKVLSDIWKAASGRITLCGQPLSSYRPRQIARLIGQVGQSNVLDAPFAVRDVVLMGRNPHLGRFEIERPQDRQVAEEAMRATHTLALADRPITTLSDGERQRTFLARALAQEPSILLLDEPTSNLDIRHQIDILATVQRLAHQRRLGVLIAMHDLSLAARFCDRLILMCEGAVIAEGTPEAVLAPEHLASAFGVQAQPYRDPFTHDLKLSIQG
jgi:iron complex transport system ATP-binding protein